MPSKSPSTPLIVFVDVAGLEQDGERVLLVPHRLRRDHEALALHLPALATEGR